MAHTIEGTELWAYLSDGQRQLALDGMELCKERHDIPARISDYSYLVFPMAKLYEGFLKQLFLDLSIISDTDYTSDHYRIGKALSPNLVRRLGKHSAYREMRDRFGADLADQMWYAWKEGRNMVFHYYPHNFRALTHEQAEAKNQILVTTMEEVVRRTGVKRRGINAFAIRCSV